MTSATVRGTNPVRWWVFDAGVDPVYTPLPSKESAVWEVRYENPDECGKRTLRDLSTVAPGYARTLHYLRSLAGVWSGQLGYGVVDDPVLHGGGLHVTGPGGHLGVHLDYALHPDGVHERALNVLAFMHPEWKEEWGGELVLTDPYGKIVERFVPYPGRVVAFEVGDLSYHGVQPTSPDAPDRVSLAAYYLCPVGAPRPGQPTGPTRTRALFIPRR